MCERRVLGVAGLKKTDEALTIARLGRTQGGLQIPNLCLIHTGDPAEEFGEEADHHIGDLDAGIVMRPLDEAIVAEGGVAVRQPDLGQVAGDDVLGVEDVARILQDADALRKKSLKPSIRTRASPPSMKGRGWWRPIWSMPRNIW